MHLKLSGRAEADLESALDYLAVHFPSQIDKFLIQLDMMFHHLETFPMLGKTGRLPGTREIPIPRSPMIVIYSINEPYDIEVERVIHGALRWPPEDDG